MRARLDRGNLSEHQFNEVKKNVAIHVGTETKCRKCKRLVETNIESKL